MKLFTREPPRAPHQKTAAERTKEMQRLGEIAAPKLTPQESERMRSAFKELIFGFAVCAAAAAAGFWYIRDNKNKAEKELAAPTQIFNTELDLYRETINALGADSRAVRNLLNLAVTEQRLKNKDITPEELNRVTRALMIINGAQGEKLRTLNRQLAEKYGKKEESANAFYGTVL